VLIGNQFLLSSYASFYLTPEGPRPFFSKNTPNLPFIAQEAQMKFFVHFCTFNHPRLLGEYVQFFFAKVDYMDSEIITFEVERKVLFPYARQG
jgi:hypothetical protein